MKVEVSVEIREIECIVTCRCCDLGFYSELGSLCSISSRDLIGLAFLQDFSPMCGW